MDMGFNHQQQSNLSMGEAASIATIRLLESEVQGLASWVVERCEMAARGEEEGSSAVEAAYFGWGLVAAAIGKLGRKWLQ